MSHRPGVTCPGTGEDPGGVISVSPWPGPATGSLSARDEFKSVGGGNFRTSDSLRSNSESAKCMKLFEFSIE